MRFKLTRSLLLTLVLIVATPALAVDGVLEINQTCAVQTGCFAGDTPTFPVTIQAAGSYRLTGNLLVLSSAQHGIEVLVEGVSIDLAGFEIRGPELCSGDPVTCASPDTGDAIHSVQRAVRVRNGSVRGLGKTGIALGDDCSVRDVTALLNAALGIDVGSSCEVRGNRSISNGSIGIRLGNEGLVIENIVNGNVGLGMDLGGLTGFAGNVLTANNGGDFNPQISGGVATGANVCGSGAASCVSCPTGLVDCGGFCVDLATDEANCGSCGGSCTGGEFCSLGVCVAAAGCPVGQVDCGNYCADLSNDELHCGSCNSACPAGDVCITGACGLVCSGGSVQCGAQCVDLANNPNHCGACNSVCGGGICVAGSCL